MIPKTPKDLLLDIFVEVPALLEDLDAVLACTDSSRIPSLREDITRRCWLLETQLLTWREEVDLADPEQPTCTVADPSPSPALDLIATAHILCLYWSMFIIIYSTLRAASPEGTTPPTALPVHADPRIYCRRIAEVVSILLHPDAGAYGVHLANFPTAIALLCLNATTRDGDGEPEEKRMILETLRRSSNGRTTGRFVTSTQKQDLRFDRPAAGDDGLKTPSMIARSWLGLR